MVLNFDDRGTVTHRAILGKPVRCWRWPQELGMPCCRWIPVA
nr:Uncharacterised protein [Klebsiella pneumoniae]